MNRSFVFFLLGFLIIGSAGCARTADSPAGFRLPDGDAANGRRLFVEFQCNECHSVAGEKFPAALAAGEPYVELGGAVTKVKTYAELVTGIINPSHRLAEGYAKDQVFDDDQSKMTVYNDYMTVSELTDLVMFLQPHYRVIVPGYKYRVYP